MKDLIENKLNYLIQNSSSLSEDEKSELNQLLLMNEYFLVVQNFCYGVIKENRPILKKEVEIVFDVMKLMGANDRNDEDYWLWEEFSKSTNKLWD